MSTVKTRSSTPDLQLKLPGLRTVEEDGTASVGVKSLDIGRNAGDEGGLLGRI